MKLTATNFTPTVRTQSPISADVKAADTQASTSAPVTTDVVQISVDKEALKTEQAQVGKHAKIGAYIGGAIGTAIGAAAGFAGGAVGLAAGLVAAPAAAVIGAAALGAGAFMAVTHNSDGALALIGGLVAGAVGAAAGGYLGFWGGAALGGLVGAGGGIAGGLAGAFGVGTLSAGIGAVANAAKEVLNHKENYPNFLADLKQSQKH